MGVTAVSFMHVYMLMFDRLFVLFVELVEISRKADFRFGVESFPGRDPERRKRTGFSQVWLVSPTHETATAS